MRHLMEVMLVVESKEGWARKLAAGRREQRRPLPSVKFMGSSHHVAQRATRSGSPITAGLLRMIAEGLNKDLGRLIVSFI